MHLDLGDNGSFSYQLLATSTCPKPSAGNDICYIKMAQHYFCCKCEVWHTA